MNKLLLKYMGFLAILLIVVFGIQLFILRLLNQPLFGNLIIFSYVVNYLLALIIVFTLYRFSIKYHHLLGYIFMVGSFLKFGVFFVFFYPIFKLDGHISILETTSFLIPYAICLLAETTLVSKVLNNL